MKNNSILILLMLVLLTGSALAVEFSGDVTGVSTYVWRGVKQFDGVAMQGTAGLTSGPVTVGFWSSTMHGPMEVETDPFVQVSLPAGEISTAVGATLYSYDFFAKSEYNVYEVYGALAYGAAGVTFFYTPEQENMDESVYWLEVSGGSTLLGADVGATLGYGTYSSSTDDAVTTLTLSAGKSVSDNVAVSWNYSIGVSDDDNLENIFFMTAGYSF
ncbi:MAG: hypothetical protein U5R06_19190 [candidate division KSB1 bacterium]|nr:hypothetical protein [candidate division KSB1 bacterium]